MAWIKARLTAFREMGGELEHTARRLEELRKTYGGVSAPSTSCVPQSAGTYADRTGNTAVRLAMLEETLQTLTSGVATGNATMKNVATRPRWKPRSFSVWLQSTDVELKADHKSAKLSLSDTKRLQRNDCRQNAPCEPTRKITLFIRTFKKLSDTMTKWDDTIWTVMVEKAIVPKSVFT